jgi:hypothetical protein
MTELIKIIHDKRPVGFGKPRRVELPGVKFDDGQIAYMDEDKTVRQSDNGTQLKKELKNAIIEVLA